MQGNKLEKIIKEHYSFETFNILYKNKDAANDVYIINTNIGSVVLKIITSDTIPSSQQLDIIFDISNEFSYIPKILKNKDGKFITNNNILVTSYLDGEVIDGKPISIQAIKPVIDLLIKLNSYSIRNFVFEPWYLTLKTKKEYPSLKDIDFSKCSKGLVHGDLNHLNILVKNGHITGILDWDGIHYDFVVTDFAIFITHNLLTESSFHSIRGVVDLLLEKFRLSDNDIQLLHIFIEMRIDQILRMLKDQEANEVIRKHIDKWANKYILLKEVIND